MTEDKEVNKIKQEMVINFSLHQQYHKKTLEISFLRQLPIFDTIYENANLCRRTNL